MVGLFFNLTVIHEYKGRLKFYEESGIHEKVARKIGWPKPPFVSTSLTNAVPL